MGCNQLSITSLKLGHGRLIASNIKLWVWLVFRAGTLIRTCPQIAKFMGPTWGPPGSCRPQVGPMLAQWTLLSGHNYRTLLVKALEFGSQKHVTHAVQLGTTPHYTWYSVQMPIGIIQSRKWQSDLAPYQLSISFHCSTETEMYLMDSKKFSIMVTPEVTILTPSNAANGAIS